MIDNEIPLDIDGIKAIFHRPSMTSQKFIVACHGLFSSKNSRKYIELGTYFRKKGYHVLRFDFRGCGNSAGNFLEATIENRIKDLTEVLDFICKYQSTPNIGLFGSSLGGVISVLLASRALFPQIQALVIWSTPSRLSVTNNLPEVYQHDFRKYNILQASQNLPPTLIVHGARDRVVPISQAYTLFRNAGFPKKIRIFDTDHRFSSEKERQKAFFLSLNWFNNYM
jgi:alpha-beta hydrolase superfamily lysophospholipase